MARRLIAKSHYFLEESIQFLAGQLYFNTDNMAVFASWLGDGGGGGISDKGKTAVVIEEATSNISYKCHYQRNTTCDLNGLKLG